MKPIANSLLVVFLSVSACGASAQGLVTLKVVALSGDASPDGNGSLSFFSEPVLNDAGQVAFSASLLGTSGGPPDSGIFLADGTSDLKQLVRQGQTAPDGNGTINASSQLAINDTGQVVYFGRLTGTSGGGNDDSAIYALRSMDAPIQLLREGQTSPDGRGIFPNLVSSSPALNDSGQVAFRSTIIGTGGGSDTSGIFRVGDTGTSSLTQLAGEGEPSPDGNGTLSGVSLGFVLNSLNNAGQVAFRGVLTGTSGGDSDNSAVFRAGGINGLELLVREGQAAPDGNGNFSNLDSLFTFVPVINDVGQVAFGSPITGTTGGDRDDFGIFRVGDADGIVQLVRKGEALPDGNGIFSFLGNRLLNNAGQIAFSSSVEDPDGNSGNEGIFLGDGVSDIVQIARRGQLDPRGDVAFNSLSLSALNDAGQVLFVGSLTGGIVNQGIYLYDETHGIVEVTRTGNMILGSRITEISVTPGATDDEVNGLNERGQVAFQFTLADGRRGIAVSSFVPEPSTLAIGCLGLLALLLPQIRSVR